MVALDSVFKAYDIRGTVPDQLDADLAGAVGAAFARFAGASRVLVARDMRPSGVELTAAFVRPARLNRPPDTWWWPQKKRRALGHSKKPSRCIRRRSN